MGEGVREIPRSVFYMDAIDNDVTGEPATTSTFFVEIPQAMEGTYEVLVTGLRRATSTVLVGALSSDHGSQPFAEARMLLSPGSATSLQVEFASFPGAITRIVDQNGNNAGLGASGPRRREVDLSARSRNSAIETRRSVRMGHTSPSGATAVEATTSG